MLSTGQRWVERGGAGGRRIRFVITPPESIVDAFLAFLDLFDFDMGREHAARRTIQILKSARRPKVKMPTVIPVAFVLRFVMAIGKEI